MNTSASQLQQPLRPQIQQLETSRLQLLAQRKAGMKFVFGSLFGGVLLGLVAAVAIHPIAAIFAIILGAIATLIIYNLKVAPVDKEFKSQFKLQFMANLIKTLQPGMNYSPLQGISEQMFVSSELSNKRPDRYSSEDLIHGHIDKTKLSLSEVHAEERYETRDSDGDRKTEWRDIFRGILVIADFNKHFNQTVKVFPDVGEKYFGWLGKKMQSLGGKVQRMENPEFKKLFVVYGDDAVETRYLLTPDLQERLIELRQKHGKGVMLVFKDSSLIMGMPSTKDWFEGNIKTPVHDTTQVQNLITELHTCFSIVEDLNLSTRIWTKE